MSSAKSFDIAKAHVWDAYLAVKASKGGPGIDGIGMDEFERDLKTVCTKSGIGFVRGVTFRHR